MELRPRWGCPDLGPEGKPGHLMPIVGSSYEFDDCPAYYLRTAVSDREAIHLLDDGTHVASLVRDWAFEIESGARSIDTLSTKARDSVHLYLSEKASRERKLGEMRRDARGQH